MTDYKKLCAELVDQLKQSAEVHWHYGYNKAARQCDAVVECARAALAEADEPAVPEGREPAAVTGHPSDEELYDYWISTSPEFGCANPVGYARAVLARWDCSQPAPNKPTVMEIIELADKIEEAGLGQVDLVQAALARWGQPAPQPVPVSERLPGPEDCDELGRCWCWTPPVSAAGSGYWWFAAVEWSEDVTHWLPAHALPLP